MTKRNVILFAMGLLAGIVASAPALALYKCTTKAGVTYQDKPCMEPSLNEVATAAASRADRPSARGQPAEADRPKSAAAQRKVAEQASDHEEWQARATKKADSVRSCATRETRCNANALRAAAMYLSEAQLEGVLGTPEEKSGLGMERTSQWTVRVNDAGRLQSVKLTAAWGLCSDERNYFASGQGQRACKVSVD